MKNGQKQQLSDLPKIVKHTQDDPHKSSQTDPSQDCYSRSLKLWIKWINFTWQPHASRDGEKRNPKGKKIRNFIIWGFCCQWNLETFRRHSYLIFFLRTSESWIQRKNPPVVHLFFVFNIPHDCSTGRIPETIWRLEDSLGLRKGLPRIGAKLWSISFQGSAGAQEFPRKLRFKKWPADIVSDVKNEWIQTLDIEKKDMKHSLLHFREGIHEVAKTFKKCIKLKIYTASPKKASPPVIFFGWIIYIGFTPYTKLTILAHQQDRMILLMEEILHHLGCIKPCK